MKPTYSFQPRVKLSRLAVNRAILLAVMAMPYLFTVEINPGGLTLGRHYSYAAPACIVLIFPALWLFFARRPRLSTTAWACIGVSGALCVAGLVNGTFVNGTLLSILQLWLASVLFCYLLTEFCRRHGERVFIRRIAVLLAFGILINGWLTVQNDLFVTFVYGKEILGGGANWNVIGIGYVCIFALLITGVMAKESPVISAIGIVPCVIGIMLSFSRSAYIAFGVVVLAAACSAGMRRLGRVVGILALFAGMAAIAMWFGYQAFPGAQKFISNKVAVAATEMVDERLGEKNIQPIKDWASGEATVLIFGDGKSIEHSVFSQSLVMTGLCGFIATLFFYFQIVARSFSSLRSSKGRKDVLAGPLWVLMGLTVGMFSQDCVGNLINMNGFASSLFVIVVAVLEPRARRVGVVRASAVPVVRMNVPLPNRPVAAYQLKGGSSRVGISR